MSTSYGAILNHINFYSQSESFIKIFVIDEIFCQQEKLTPDFKVTKNFTNILHNQLAVRIF